MIKLAVRKKTVDAIKSEAVQSVQVKFTKEQVLASGKYQHRRDLLNALLKDGENYTIESVDGLIEMFMKGQVK